MRPRHGTRMRRAVPAMLLGFAALSLLQLLVGSNALAVTFNTTDARFRIYSNYIQGEYGAGFLARNTAVGTTGDVGVAEIGFKTAKLAGLCAITEQELPGGLGTLTMLITAGQPVRASFDNHAVVTSDAAGRPIELDASGLLTGASLAKAVTVSDLFLNTTSLSGYGNNFSGLDLGKSADAVHDDAHLEWSASDPHQEPVAGDFGLNARHLNLSGLDGDSYGVNLAGLVRLPGMRIDIKKGSATQADCSTEATP